MVQAQLQCAGGKQVMGEKAQSKARTELLSFQQLLQQWSLISNLCTSAEQVRTDPCLCLNRITLSLCLSAMSWKSHDLMCC